MKTKEHAFTLLEIMLVVTIITLLLGAAIFKMGGNVEVARETKVQGDLQGIRTQLRLYESMSGFLPSTEQGLSALVTKPASDPQPARWTQLFSDLPRDPWGNNYIYLNPGKKNPSGFDLYSAGPDRQAETADDISG